MFVSQRKLRMPEQVPALVESIRRGDPIPAILLSEDEDGSIQVEDGHHRATAYVLAKRDHLSPHEYLLIQRGRQRPRFGRIRDLITRVQQLTNNLLNAE